MTLSGPVVPPRQGEPQQLVVLLHGWGADGNDLIGLAPALQPTLPQARFVSPNAPDPAIKTRWAASGTASPTNARRN